MAVALPDSASRPPEGAPRFLSRPPFSSPSSAPGRATCPYRQPPTLGSGQQSGIALIRPSGRQPDPSVGEWLYAVTIYCSRTEHRHASRLGEYSTRGERERGPLGPQPLLRKPPNRRPHHVQAHPVPRASRTVSFRRKSGRGRIEDEDDCRLSTVHCPLSIVLFGCGLPRWATTRESVVSMSRFPARSPGLRDPCAEEARHRGHGEERSIRNRGRQEKKSARERSQLSEPKQAAGRKLLGCDPDRPHA